MNRYCLAAMVCEGVGECRWLLPLAAKIQLFNDVLVTFEVFALQVIEQLSSLRRHHEQAPPGMEILSVGLQVLGQVSDAFGKQGDLHLAGSRVLFMDAVFLYYVLFVDVFGHDLFIWFLGTRVLPLQNRASAEAGGAVASRSSLFGVGPRVTEETT